MAASAGSPPDYAAPHPGDGLSELHLRRLIEGFAIFADLEELSRPEAEQAGEQRGRELLDAGVVLLHRIVEEAPRRREFVFDIREFGLQLLEIGIGLEIRIEIGRASCRERV